MRILFISRAYPPIVGGLEKHNRELARHLSKIADTKIIANRGGKIYLPIFLPYVSIRSLFLMRRHDVLLLGDGVLAIAGYLVKLVYGQRKKVVCICHGLDLTYALTLYRWLWVRVFIPRLDRLVAVGKETIKAGILEKIPENKFVFIPNGINPDENFSVHSKTELEKIIDEKLAGKRVILTCGRLVKRKGVAWFIRNVLPKLEENIIYVVLGDGPDKKNILAAISAAKLEKKVRFLGYQPDRIKNILLNTCDIFVQPNIKVRGDMEGFGISVIEATTCKLPVVVANLEGLRDAIQDGRNGFLVESGNADAWANKINELLSNDEFRKDFGEKARKFTIENYSWENVAKRYLRAIGETVK